MTRKTRNAREDLLLTAERLFAERGFSAVSLRAINTEGGYSVAALHYHFRTKNELIASLFHARQLNVMARRAELVEDLRKRSKPSVLGLAEALVLPFAELILADPEAGLRTVKLFFQAYVSRNEIPLVQTTTQDSLRLFDPLLKKVLPLLDRKSRHTRWLLATELTFQGLANYESILGKENADISDAERKRYVAQLVDFIAGGLTTQPRES